MRCNLLSLLVNLQRDKRLNCYMPCAMVLILALNLGVGCSKSNAEGRAKSDAPKTRSTPATSRVAVKQTQRLVTLGGAVTEIVYALGRGEQVVGNDLSSTFPKDATQKPRVGYYRKISPEGVLALKPTKILAIKGIGPQTAVDQLGKVGIPIHYVDGSDGVEAATKRVREIGKLLGEEEKANALVVQMNKQLTTVKTRAAQHNGMKPRVLFVYARGANVLMVSGKNTSADTMLKLAGAQNVMTEFERFKPLTPESVIKAAPDYIVIPAKGQQSVGGLDGVLKLPGVAQTPAGKHKQIIAVDDLKLLGFGPRYPDALVELQDKLKVGQRQVK